MARPESGMKRNTWVVDGDLLPTETEDRNVVITMCSNVIDCACDLRSHVFMMLPFSRMDALLLSFCKVKMPIFEEY